jgi:hypothetical protein
MLSAIEGADLVGQGCSDRRNPFRLAENEDSYTYTCENCGSHSFTVSATFTEEVTIIESIPCHS